MAETPAERARFEAEGRQAVVRLKMPTEGTLVLDDLVRGRRRVPVGPRAGPRGPADRRLVPLPPGQRGGRPRFPDHPRDPRRGAPLEHAAAGVHPRGARLSAAGVRPSAVRGRAGQPEQAEQAEARQVSEEPRLRPTGRARPEDRRSDRSRRRGRHLQPGDRRFLRDGRLPARGDHQLPGPAGLVAGREDARILRGRS